MTHQTPRFVIVEPELPDSTYAVMSEVLDECKRQDEKWGMQEHEPMAWLGILAEEFGEAAKETVQITFGHPWSTNYRAELIHTAAVAMRAVENYDRHVKADDLKRKMVSKPKGAPPRGEIKGQIDLSDLFGLDTADARHQFREKALTDPMFSAAVKIILQLLPDHEYEREMVRQQRIAGE